MVLTVPLATADFMVLTVEMDTVLTMVLAYPMGAIDSVVLATSVGMLHRTRRLRRRKLSVVALSGEDLLD